MTRVLVAILLVLSFGFSAQADEQLPFEPALAADQPKITIESLDQEADQFQHLATYKDLSAKLEVKAHHSKHLSASYERGRRLIDSEGITRTELDRRAYELALNELQVDELKHQVRQSALQGEASRFGVLHEGDAGDYRKEVVERQRGALQEQLRSLVFTHKAAELSKTYYANRMEELSRLRSGKHVGLQEHEEMEEQFEEAESRSISSSHQILVLNRAVQGLQRSLEKLTEAEKP